MEQKIKTERGDLLEFDDHFFLLEPANNWHPNQVCMKSAQVGFSTLSILKTIYAARHRGYNCIYTLPTFDDIKDFVPSKVDKMLEINPTLADLRGDVDSLTKKSIGENFIWYRGTHSNKAALSHSSDLNVYDEYDASNPSVIDTYRSRLNKSVYKGEWTFSNPIRPGGIDQLYLKSDQRRFTIQCSRCNHWQDLDYWANVDEEQKVYVCAKCKQPLSEDDRHDGEWVAGFPGRDLQGYHINQLMCPWVTAKELCYLKEVKTPQFFYNMVLGLPYVETDDVVTADLIKNSFTTESNYHMNCALGVDVGHRRLHYVLGNHQGIFKVGTITSEDYWGDLEVIMRTYKPMTVIDNGPDFYPKREYLEKRNAPCPVFLCYYQKSWMERELIKWPNDSKKAGMVYTKRSQIIQAVVDEFGKGNIRINVSHKDSELLARTEFKEYIDHWENIYRVVEPNRSGINETTWKTKGADHFVHATAYWWMALQRVPMVDPLALHRVDTSGIALLSHEILDGRIPAGQIPLLAVDDSFRDDDWLYN